MPTVTVPVSVMFVNADGIVVAMLSVSAVNAYAGTPLLIAKTSIARSVLACPNGSSHWKDKKIVRFVNVPIVCTASAPAPVSKSLALGDTARGSVVGAYVPSQLSRERLTDDTW